MSKKQHAVVVDASVARAAGDATTTSTVSSMSRSCLQAMLDADLALVTSEEILDEWRRHRSRYSGRWLKSMFARKRVQKVQPPQHARLRRACAALSPLRRADAEKDLHLVEAALGVDQRIISLDDKARALFVGLSVSVKTLVTLHWGHAGTPACLKWLQASTPHAKPLQLGATTRT